MVQRKLLKEALFFVRGKYNVNVKLSEVRGGSNEARDVSRKLINLSHRQHTSTSRKSPRSLTVISAGFAPHWNWIEKNALLSNHARFERVHPPVTNITVNLRAHSLTAVPGHTERRGGEGVYSFSKRIKIFTEQ